MRASHSVEHHGVRLCNITLYKETANLQLYCSCRNNMLNSRGAQLVLQTTRWLPLAQEMRRQQPVAVVGESEVLTACLGNDFHLAVTVQAHCPALSILACSQSPEQIIPSNEAGPAQSLTHVEVALPESVGTRLVSPCDPVNCNEMITITMCGVEGKLRLISPGEIYCLEKAHWGVKGMVKR